MTVLKLSVVRSAALAVALVGYTQLYPLVFPDEAIGADIGFGLLAFLLLAVTAGTWSALDATRRPYLATVAVWGLVAVAVSVGWLAVDSIHYADQSMSASELFWNDLGLVGFTFWLIAVPAIGGAAIGAAARKASGPTSPQQQPVHSDS